MIQIFKDTVKENTYEIDCEIISPLFIGNAIQEPEIREQSINGVLRWYFRAAGGSKETESIIFGSTSNISTKGLFKLKVNPVNIKNLDYQKFETDVRVKYGYQYLGFSLKMNKRKAIDINSKFNMIIHFKPFIDENYKKKFFATLWLAFNLGNFGARSRRGFGSIKINSIFHNNQKINEIFGINFIPNFSNQNQIIEHYTQNLNKIKEFFKNEQKIKNIPNLFDNFFIYLLNDTSNNYLDILNKIGVLYRDFRRRIIIESRIVFGLPLKNFDMRLRRSSLLTFKPIKSNNDYNLLVIKTLPTNKNQFIFHPELESEKQSNDKSRFKKEYYNNLENFLSNNLKKIYEPV